MVDLQKVSQLAQLGLLDSFRLDYFRLDYHRIGRITYRSNERLRPPMLLLLLISPIFLFRDLYSAIYLLLPCISF